MRTESRDIRLRGERMVRHRQRSARVYALSKGKTEQNRLAGQHWLFFAATGANYFAPLPRGPKMILDVGCGTGLWMFEIARRFRQARLYGFDTDKASFDRQAAKEFPAGLPRRFTFEVASALAPFPYDAATFDFTHSRCLSPFVPLGRWPQIVAEMARVTRPGGWVESVETMFPVSASAKYQVLAEAGQALARKLNVYLALHEPHQQAGFLRAAGLEQVGEYHVVLGKDADEQEALARDIALGSESVRPLLLDYGFLTEQQFNAAREGLEEELLACGVTMDFYAAWGQRPGKEET